MSCRAAQASQAEGKLRHWKYFVLTCLSPEVLLRTAPAACLLLPAAGTGLPLWQRNSGVHF